MSTSAGTRLGLGDLKGTPRDSQKDAPQAPVPTDHSTTPPTPQPSSAGTTPTAQADPVRLDTPDTETNTSPQRPFAGAIVFVLVAAIVLVLVHLKLSFTWTLIVGVVLLLVATRLFVPKFLPDTSERPKPTIGRQKTLYTLLRLVGIKYTPKLGTVELRQIEENERSAQALREEEARNALELQEERKWTQAFHYWTDYLIGRLRLLAKLGIQPTMSFCNIKSGSKTTVAVYVSSVIAEYTRKNVLLLPATQNTATSTAGIVSGITDGKLITVSKLSEDIDEFGAYRVVSNRLPLTKHGLGVVCEDANSIITDEAEADYAMEQFDRIVRTLYPNLDVLILDHGNDDLRVGSIVLSAVRFSDVLNFVAMAPTPISIKTMVQTINGYNTDTIGRRELHDNPLPGELATTRDKVQHSIIAVSGVRPTDSVDISDLATDRPLTVNADQPPSWEGNGFYVPWDPYIASEAVTVCDLTKIQPETLQAFLEIAVANYEEAARIQGFKDVPPGEAKPAVLTSSSISPEATQATTPERSSS